MEKPQVDLYGNKLSKDKLDRMFEFYLTLCKGEKKTPIAKNSKSLSEEEITEISHYVSGHFFKVGRMTSKEYKDASGNYCPFCGSCEIESCGDIRSNSGYAWQEIHCNCCDSDYQETYVLSGYGIRP